VAVYLYWAGSVWGKRSDLRSCSGVGRSSPGARQMWMRSRTVCGMVETLPTHPCSREILFITPAPVSHSPRLSTFLTTCDTLAVGHRVGMSFCEAGQQQPQGPSVTFGGVRGTNLTKDSGDADVPLVLFDGGDLVHPATQPEHLWGCKPGVPHREGYPCHIVGHPP
jgi:hypothetical protein